MYSTEKSPPLEETAVLFHSIPTPSTPPPSFSSSIHNTDALPPPQSHTLTEVMEVSSSLYTEPQRLRKLWLVPSSSRKKENSSVCSVFQCFHCRCSETWQLFYRLLLYLEIFSIMCEEMHDHNSQAFKDLMAQEARHESSWVTSNQDLTPSWASLTIKYVWWFRLHLLKQETDMNTTQGPNNIQPD